MPKITATYHMQDWKEDVLRALAEPQKLASVHVHGVLDGPIAGHGESFMLLAYVTGHTGIFKDCTIFEGVLEGRTGTFMMAGEGTFDPKSATLDWTILEGSGTGGFTGIAGSGGYRATHGLDVEFSLDYRFGD